ncbi:MAG: (p)ppGpp synthetase [Rhodanobacter sp.]|nr:MAG: (p)ppGpp synthetase [Rhodanobacter sp.]TAM11026.1 MAG: (p)ppGpp synthetase [Rhodanobacter sp.]TAM35575.1 MAG: (p)ppGpp synthetase [Rhodanobacter sp.]
MTALTSLNSKERAKVEAIVARYVSNRDLVQTMLDQLRMAIEGHAPLMACVHSLRWRIKDTDHLREKLTRKALKAKTEGSEFRVTPENLFETINDLAGLRILHLHSGQIVAIDKSLRDLFQEFRYEIVEEPKARTWDDESREFFRSIGIEPVESPTMYTSVHYVIAPNSQTRVTCELQVRTLAEELWGEVDHTMNYPHKSPVDTCCEQIKVLARVTSSCTRLVDSIFRASSQYESPRGTGAPLAAPAPARTRSRRKPA